MNRYLTTTLPYVNADPHIGFALELIQADALVRTWRLEGDDVFFSTGTDEHGQKIFEAAEKVGVDVHAYVDGFAAKVQALKETLDLSTNTFIRTTEPRHYAAAQEMWRRCEAAGDIYKKSYTGLYCVGCEEYKTERELTADGHCLLHPAMMIQEITEENYFFRFSKYEDALRDYLARPGVIVPEWRREEAQAFVKGGLHDFSISREKEKLSWGIPVPGDDAQVMYVWFDALINYISTLGWPGNSAEAESRGEHSTEGNGGGNFEKYWTHGETLQIAGKDQVRFQSLMWQAMLMSAKLKPTDTVFYHGFINSGGQKMSKSLGNVINPYDLVAKYGIDATRYLLLRHVLPVDDSDVTWERLDEWHTANLVNGLGNLVARVMKLAGDHFESPVSLESGDTVIHTEFTNRIKEFRFNEAADFIFDMIAECDAIMTSREPFKKVKSDAEEVRAEGKADIALLVRHLAKIGTHLAPLMPKTSVAILAAVHENKKPENLFPRLMA